MVVLGWLYWILIYFKNIDIHNNSNQNIFILLHELAWAFITLYKFLIIPDCISKFPIFIKASLMTFLKNICSTLTDFP